MRLLGSRRRQAVAVHAPATPDDPGTPTGSAQDRFGHDVLDSMQANIVVTDGDFRVVYANPRARATLTRMEPDLGRAVGSSEIIGADLLRLHREPQQLRDQIGAPGFNGGGTLLTVGPNTLGAQINRVGTTGGYTVTFADITAKLAADEQAKNETREVSAALATVTGASEELTGTALSIAQYASEASRTVAEAIAGVEAANRTMVQLGEASGRINDIVMTITQVADQTNLLALNATIEAARAGELGKGFAVVAGEVKELSKQTKAATERINQMIGEVQSLSGAAMEAMTMLAGVIDRVDAKQRSIAETVDQQTSTTRDINASLAVAADRARLIADFVAGNRRS